MLHDEAQIESGETNKRGIRVIFMVAMTMDGYIARNTHESSVTWTSRADKRLFRQRTKQAGVVVMGRVTFETLPGPLKDRTLIVMTRTPQQHNTNEQVIFTSASPNEIVANLEAQGHSEVVIAGGSSVYEAFLRDQCVDEIWITLHPHVFGSGVPFLGNHALERSFSLNSVGVLPDDPNVLLLKYETLE